MGDGAASLRLQWSDENALEASARAYINGGRRHVTSARCGCIASQHKRLTCGLCLGGGGARAGDELESGVARCIVVNWVLDWIVVVQRVVSACRGHVGLNRQNAAAGCRGHGSRTGGGHGSPAQDGQYGYNDAGMCARALRRVLLRLLSPSPLPPALSSCSSSSY
jgi:hypothetical protein